MIMKQVRTPTYNYNFNEDNGYFERWGSTPDDDPQYSPIGLEILDMEVSTICHKGCQFCFVDGTLVKIENGNKNIEDLVTGDVVYSYNGINIEKDVVTETMKRFVEEDIFEITLENNEKIFVTKEHPFFANNKWVEASELKVGDNILNYDKNLFDMPKRI